MTAVWVGMDSRFHGNDAMLGLALGLILPDFLLDLVFLDGLFGLLFYIGLHSFAEFAVLFLDYLNITLDSGFCILDLAQSLFGTLGCFFCLVGSLASLVDNLIEFLSGFIIF